MERLRQEVFYLGYYLHWSPGEVMALDSAERRDYLRQLEETLERERRNVEQAQRRSHG